MGLVSARKKAGLSQSEVAKALGITNSAVCQWETGKTAPRAFLLVKLATIYDCTVDELLKSDDPANKAG